MNTQKKLVKEIEIYCTLLANAPWENRTFYGNWLAQTYHFVQHNLKLIALAAAYTEPGEYKDYNRYVEHMREESGHEYMAKRDLEKLGFHITEFPEQVETKSLYSLAYFNIPRYGHESLIGYAVCLEMIADKLGIIINEKVTSFHGHSSEFLKVHGEEDEAHLVEAFKLVENLTGGKQRLFEKTFYETCIAYRNFWQACLPTDLKKEMSLDKVS
ncbi:MAG: iron-containing redox enzyme family protein [Bdellovibrionota bacterium]|nr:iron-containing redox enzyme family protein [Bdellovibrionota bacterium]